MRVAGSFDCRGQSIPPCSVSTSRSSNRTGGFPASGSPTGFARRPTEQCDLLLHRRPWALPQVESVAGGCRQHGHSPNSPHFQTAPEVRPLPSTNVTWLLRYYGPVRHPTRPGLSLTGVRLVLANHRWGFPCYADFLLRRAVVITPAGPSTGIKDHSPECNGCGLPLYCWRVGSCEVCFRGLLDVHSRYGPHAR